MSRISLKTLIILFPFQKFKSNLELMHWYQGYGHGVFRKIKGIHLMKFLSNTDDRK